MASKKSTKRKEKELPSFLLTTTIDPEDITSQLNTTKSEHLGPIFFGCPQYHPPPHSLNLGSFHYIQFSESSKENILRDICIRKTDAGESLKCYKKKNTFQPNFKNKKEVFVDIYPHKCPGTRRAFVPKVGYTEPDLGETKSIIEGETSREIPLCCLKKESSCTSDIKFEFVTLSDIREKNRMFMPYNERIAHAHFPKEFMTVRLIGPTIPADITITKLPSKRKKKTKIILDESPDLETAKQEVSEKESKDKSIESENIEETAAESKDNISAKELSMNAVVPDNVQGDDYEDLEEINVQESKHEESFLAEERDNEEEEEEEFDEGEKMNEEEEKLDEKEESPSLGEIKEVEEKGQEGEPPEE